MFFEVLSDTLLDCLKMLPFLLAAYFVIEYIERTRSEKIEKALAGGGRFGFVPGAFLGLVPQCGFSGMAANLYSGNVITAGTLVAVFVSTSDEAVPLLIAAPGGWRTLLPLLILKLILALLAGFLTDFVLMKILPKELKGGYIENSTKVDCHDHDEHESLIVATLRHTGIIMVSIFVILLIINLAVGYIGSDRLAGFIESTGVLQFLITPLIGMIPNCASSVLLTQMYAAGQLPFASMFAGLCAGSGIGTLVLFRTEKNKKRVIAILGIIYVYSVFIGLVLSALTK
ncbi:MAG: putative manganese transporter [Lachnospiraceae bacterium]|nr:putative manganese transporter [Lachnospiraceae bacterium]